ncbi:MAG: GHKL domain-containing protein [Agarilytica sp.]
MAHYLVTAVIDFIVAIIALSKTGNRSAKALSLTSFSLGLWSLELFLLTVVQNVDLLSVLFHITRWGMFLIPPSLALLAWMLIGGRSRLFFNVVVLPGFIVSISLSVLNAFFLPSTLEPAQGGYLPKIDLIFFVFAGNFVWCLVGSVFESIASFRSATYREKQRVKWLLIILLMTLSTGVASMLLVKYDFYLKLVGATTNITFVSLLLYATVQHHLMDLRLALSVGLARAVLLTTVVWSYFFISSVIGDINQSTAGILIMLLFIVFVLEAYPRALRWVLPNTKRLIAGNSYEFESVTGEAQKALNSSIDLKGLMRVTDTLMKHITRVKHYYLYTVEDGDLHEVTPRAQFISEEDRKILLDYCREHKGLIISDETPAEVQYVIMSSGANACLSVFYDGRVVAIVLVGPSLDQSYYRYDDIRVFEWLGFELGQVINRIDQLDEMQDQLGQAKKTLSMLGVMNHYHHDIKAPLAIIDGVLSNDIYDKDKQKDIVLQQVERGSQLITTMAGILKGERKRKLQSLSLSEVVKDSVFLFSQGIDEVNYLFGDTPNINGDAEDLKILVINVVKNAIEARNESQRLVVTISTWQSESDGHVYLSFSDTGVGISSDLLDVLWDETVSSKAQGNGIGMQAIKRIADEHFAEIEVNSEVGSGCEFVFKFPRSIVVADSVDGVAENNDSIFASSNKVKKPLAG